MCRSVLSMNAQNLGQRQRERERVEKIGGNSGGRGDKFRNSSWNIAAGISRGAQRTFLGQRAFLSIFARARRRRRRIRIQAASLQQVKIRFPFSLLVLFIIYERGSDRSCARLKRCTTIVDAESSASQEATAILLRVVPVKG